MATRRRYRRKDGTMVRGTFLKPKFYGQKLAVDLDFHTKTRHGKGGKLMGRTTSKSMGERVPVIRTVNDGGLIVGRAKKMTSPYPKTYPVFVKQRIKGKERIRRKSIPVGW